MIYKNSKIFKTPKYSIPFLTTIGAAIISTAVATVPVLAEETKPINSKKSVIEQETKTEGREYYAGIETDIEKEYKVDLMGKWTDEELEVIKSTLESIHEKIPNAIGKLELVIKKGPANAPREGFQKGFGVYSNIHNKASEIEKLISYKFDELKRENKNDKDIFDVLDIDGDHAKRPSYFSQSIKPYLKRILVYGISELLVNDFPNEGEILINKFKEYDKDIPIELTDYISEETYSIARNIKRWSKDSKAQEFLELFKQHLPIDNCYQTMSYFFVSEHYEKTPVREEKMQYVKDFFENIEKSSTL